MQHREFSKLTGSNPALLLVRKLWLQLQPWENRRGLRGLFSRWHWSYATSSSHPLFHLKMSSYPPVPPVMVLPLPCCSALQFTSLELWFHEENFYLKLSPEWEMVWLAAFFFFPSYVTGFRLHVQVLGVILHVLALCSGFWQSVCKDAWCTNCQMKNNNSSSSYLRRIPWEQMPFGKHNQVIWNVKFWGEIGVMRILQTSLLKSLKESSFE